MVTDGDGDGDTDGDAVSLINTEGFKRATPSIRLLKTSTSLAWLDLALSNLDEILLDHAACERKAAGVALNLICRYPSSRSLINALTAIAREELEHFQRVNQFLEARGIALRPLQPPPYGARLKAAVRRQEPERQLDSLLVAALIEARSHERLGLLADNCSDLALARFYRSLMASEARHYGSYWVLATELVGRDPVQHRLQELAWMEAEILHQLHPQPRMHS
ncbi:MAG: tRNA-(ms[2]io[6]A)-hydroxylase [Cyanobacteria bacterium P01_H01_bin.121]